MRWFFWGRGFMAAAWLWLCSVPVFAAVMPQVLGVDFEQRAPVGQRAQWLEVVVRIQARRVSGATELVPWRLRFSGEWQARRDAGPWLAVREVVFTPPVPETDVAVSLLVPPGVVAAWSLDREPEAWRVQLWVGDEAVPVAPTMYAEALRERVAAQAFVTRVAARTVAEDRWLLPVEATPFYTPEDPRWAQWPAFLEAAR